MAPPLRTKPPGLKELARQAVLWTITIGLLMAVMCGLLMCAVTSMVNLYYPPSQYARAMAIMFGMTTLLVLSAWMLYYVCHCLIYLVHWAYQYFTNLDSDLAEAQGRALPTK